MPDEDKKARAPTMRLRASETDSLFALYASLQEIDHAKGDMEKRIRSVPGGWRDISLIRAVLSKLIDRILEKARPVRTGSGCTCAGLTHREASVLLACEIPEKIPLEKLLALQRNMKCMSYRIYLAKPVTLPKEDVIVKGEDLATLARYAHDYSCTACDKDCNKCELGAALDHTMIQSRGHNESWSWIDCDRDYEDKDVIRLD